ncbi:MAG: DegV family protein [Clostridia bacterium]|nr:DegV family protein [Clostridia bacterium]
MLSVKIVADSSADMLTLDGISFTSVPLKIITAEREYVDDADLDVEGMIKNLDAYKGKSSTACPSPADWLAAFGDVERVFCVAITSSLSGSCNAAKIAKRDYEELHPDRRVCVIDSLSAGPELRLIVEKIAEMVEAGCEFEEICEKIEEYRKHNTGLVFMLESLKNLANNGRVSPLAAKAAGLLGLRLVGKASDRGTLEPLEKCRGERRALETLRRVMQEFGCTGGKLRIAHAGNLPAAETLQAMLKELWPAADIQISRCRGLCSFYAERGGMLIGFEKN